MRYLLFFSLFCLYPIHMFPQAPPLYIHIVSHNEPTDNLQVPLNYQQAKNNVLTLANLVDADSVKWNLQTSDGFVFGARQDEINTGGNIFETLASSPYSDNIQIDPRNKNFPNRNIADQWYLLDSLNGNPSKTVGGFIYYVCPPANDSLIDWWQYTDTVTGTYYGNKVKFDLLSGAGSLAPHCNDLNDFGIFKPDTTTDFYQHDPNGKIWCVGVGCAPVLDSLDDEQAIIDLIQGQVDSIQNGLWPANKFYVTRIMTNQREYGTLFFTKIAKVIDSLRLIPSSKLKWATITETFADFQAWTLSSGLDHSQWLCGQTSSGIPDEAGSGWRIFPNPSEASFTLTFGTPGKHAVEVYNAMGQLVRVMEAEGQGHLELAEIARGIYLIRIDKGKPVKLIRQ